MPSIDPTIQDHCVNILADGIVTALSKTGFLVGRRPTLNVALSRITRSVHLRTILHLRALTPEELASLIPRRGDKYWELVQDAALRMVLQIVRWDEFLRLHLSDAELRQLAEYESEEPVLNALLQTGN
jgi:hypothetical protein